MAANILIYGNDIGDTARNDLARSQIMDQRTRDALGGMRQTSQFLQQKGLQEDALQVRREENAENRSYRQSWENENRTARADANKARIEQDNFDAIMRGIQEGMFSPDQIEGMAPDFQNPAIRNAITGAAKSMRERQKEEFDIFAAEADRLNRSISEAPTVKPGIGWDSWGFRTENEAATQNEAARRAAAEGAISGSDKDMRPFIRFNQDTGQFEPVMQNPMLRGRQGAPPSEARQAWDAEAEATKRWVEDKRRNGGVGAPSIEPFMNPPLGDGEGVDPMLPPPPAAAPVVVSPPVVAVPESGYVQDPMTPPLRPTPRVGPAPRFGRGSQGMVPPELLGPPIDYAPVQQLPVGRGGFRGDPMQAPSIPVPQSMPQAPVGRGGFRGAAPASQAQAQDQLAIVAQQLGLDARDLAAIQQLIQAGTQTREAIDAVVNAKNSQ